MYILTIEPAPSREFYVQTVEEVFGLVDSYVCENCKILYTDAVQEVTARYNANPERYPLGLANLIDIECYDTLPDDYPERNTMRKLIALLGTGCGAELLLRHIHLP